jgi:hypothetical protein
MLKRIKNLSLTWRIWDQLSVNQQL